MIEISLHEKVFNLVKNNPEIVDIMVDLGFVHMKDPAMLNTVGKIMTLSKASKTHKISYETLEETFEAHGYYLKEDTL